MGANSRRRANSALRFTPTAAVAGQAGGGSIVSSLIPQRPARAARKSAALSASVAAARQVWMLPDGGGAAVAVAVTPGITNGHLTEVTGAGLKEGMQVITDQKAVAAK